MSAALMVLPRIWATDGSAELVSSAGLPGGELGVVDVLLAKRPHRLTLVKANADEAWDANLAWDPEAGWGFTEPKSEAVAAAVVEVPMAAPELRGHYAFYRSYTEALLRKYQKMSLEAGRVPSLLGREMFRGDVTHYKVQGFDDVVIFVLDVQRCIERLSRGEQGLVRRIAVQAYTQQETAAMLGIPLRTVIRRYNQALDELTRMFLQRKMLEGLVECSQVV